MVATPGIEPGRRSPVGLRAVAVSPHRQPHTGLALLRLRIAGLPLRFLADHRNGDCKPVVIEGSYRMTDGDDVPRDAHVALAVDQPNSHV